MDGRAQSLTFPAAVALVAALVWPSEVQANAGTALTWAPVYHLCHVGILE